MTFLSFVKMHGLGNDFVILDGRGGGALPGVAVMAAMADRQRGVGCDQIVTLAPAPDAACLMRVYNAPDAREIEACGNATRCVARLLMDEGGADAVTIRTVAGLLTARAAGGGHVAVDMGAATVVHARMPLPGAPAFVTIGNPHCVLFVDDAGAVDVPALGPRYETDPAFPDGANVSFAQITAPGHIRLRVWERHTGQTLACGSAACATVAAAVALGHAEAGADVRVTLPGGDLTIVVDKTTGRVRMTGPAAYVFTGSYAPR
jgi:diaminopimelate epimerase